MLPLIQALCSTLAGAVMQLHMTITYTVSDIASLQRDMTIDDIWWTDWLLAEPLVPYLKFSK